MSSRHSMRESLQEHGGRSRKDTRTERTHRRFFEGYTAETASKVGRDGRQHYYTRYVYTGDTYRQDLSRGRRIGVKALYVFCWLTACLLLAWSATRNVPANTVWYVTVFQAISCLALLWMLPGLIYYVSAPENMTIYTYRTMLGVHFRISRLAALAALTLSFAGSLLNLLLDRSGGLAMRAGAAALLLVSALLIGCICLVETRITYIRTEGAKDP